MKKMPPPRETASYSFTVNKRFLGGIEMIALLCMVNIRSSHASALPLPAVFRLFW